MCPVPVGKNSMQTQYHINSSVFVHRILIKKYIATVCVIFLTMKTQVGHLVFLNTSMSTKYSILNTAVSRKVVQKEHKSVRDNAERHYGKLSV